MSNDDVPPFDWGEAVIPDDVPTRIGDGSGKEQYRTCAECGADCEPEIFDGGEGVGIRIAFSCAEHGLHGVTDPFEGMR